jgi:hypothetical protein
VADFNQIYILQSDMKKDIMLSHSNHEVSKITAIFDVKKRQKGVPRHTIGPGGVHAPAVSTLVATI